MKALVTPLTILLFSLIFAYIGYGKSAGESLDKPNIIIIYTDDLGYGDLGCYGHPSIQTPAIDRMAEEGMRFTDFYSPAAICTPSRAALLTGRYAIRSGMDVGAKGVLFPESEGGLPPEEITIAEALKSGGYATAHIGKWHLGIHEGSRPEDQGFDYTIGVPYSNDMDRIEEVENAQARVKNPPEGGWNIPLIRNGKVIERPVDQTRLTERYTKETLRFIDENKDGPFFIYLAHTFPHIPLFASPEFKGKSASGIYGDVVEELDWSVGEILAALRKAKIAENTLVVFTSDNGPWNIGTPQGGSAGMLRGAKMSTWEGGQRVPAVAWWPSRIEARRTMRQPVNAMDLFTTVLSLAEIPIPSDRVIDGIDIGPAIFSGDILIERPFFYYFRGNLNACRIGPWKAHFKINKSRTEPDPQKGPLLFHLGIDPAEKYDVASEYPDILVKIQAAVDSHKTAVVPGTPQL